MWSNRKLICISAFWTTDPGWTRVGPEVGRVRVATRDGLRWPRSSRLEAMRGSTTAMVGARYCTWVETGSDT